MNLAFAGVSFAPQRLDGRRELGEGRSGGGQVDLGLLFWREGDTPGTGVVLFG